MLKRAGVVVAVALLAVAVGAVAPAAAKKKKLKGSIALMPTEIEATSTFTETETIAPDEDIECDIYKSAETGTGTSNVATSIKVDPKNPNGFITFGNPGKDLGFLIAARESLAPAFTGTTSATVTTTVSPGCIPPPSGSADSSCVPQEPYQGDPGYNAEIDKITQGKKIKGVVFRWNIDYAPGFDCDYVDPFSGFTDDAAFLPPEPTECTSKYNIKSIAKLLKKPVDNLQIDIDCTDTETVATEVRTMTQTASLDARILVDTEPVNGP